MMKTIKRPISFLSAVVMFMVMLLYFPSGTFSNIDWKLKASAEEITPSQPTGTGTSSDPYQIGTAAELYWFAALVNGTLEGVTQNTSANAVLTQDITVNTGVLKSDGTLVDDTSGFISCTPIGYYKTTTDNCPYTGTFDGQNHTISGLYFNDTNTSYVGLFGYNSGTVKNVGVVDSYFKGNNYVGGVCGYNYNGTITNCYNTGSVSGTLYVGGVCGYNYAYSSSGTATATATIENCYNTGSVSGHMDVGGVCGYNYAYSSSGTATIENCYNTGSVSGNSAVGGVCGKNYNGTITNCYNTGSVSAIDNPTYGGGVCGYNPAGIITNCYFNINNYSGNAVGSNNGVTDNVLSKTKAQFNSGEVAYLLNNSTSEGTLAWGQDLSTADSYPVLGGATVYKVNKYNGCIGNPGELSTSIDYSNTNENIYGEHDYSNGFCTFCGGLQPVTENANGVYEISNVGQFCWFAQQVNSGSTSINAVLTEDINLSGIGNWTPIGNESNKYTGTFDGQNHTIGDMSITKQGYNSGLFGYASNATIKNIIITGNITITAESYTEGYGSIVGRADNTTVNNCHSSVDITIDSTMDSTTECIGHIGGIVGKMHESNSAVSNCSYSGTIELNDEFVKVAAGIVGYATYNTVPITNCSFTGTINSNYTGKIIGIGGIFGYTRTGGDVQVTNCLSVGTITNSGDKSLTGILIGQIINGGENAGYGNNAVKNNYYISSSSLNVIGSTSNGTPTTTPATPCTKEQLASGEVAYLLNGSKSEGTLAWGQEIGKDSYPVLGGAKVYYETKSNSYSNYEPATLTTDKYDINNDGTKDSVYEISNAGQLYWFAQQVNGGNNSINAVLTADITVNTGVLNEKGELNTGDFISWTPIGNSSKKYTGTFDGQNHTISGLYFNDTSTNYVGLFGYSYNGTIKNVGVKDSYFNGKNYVGGVCGYNYASSSGTATATATIENCYNTGSVSGKEDVGGVCGYNSAKVSSSRTVTATIENCYNTGSVSGKEDVGGVCGYNYASSSSGTATATIANCYFNINNYSGKAVGYNGGTVSNNVLGKTTDEFKSGEVAYLLSQGCTVGETTYNGNIWGQTLTGENKQDYPVLDSTKKVYRNETYTGCEGNKGDATYSYSNTEEDPVYGEHDYSNIFCKFCGDLQPATKNDKGYYEISNASQLYWFAQQVNGGNTSANAVLTADITVNEGVLKSDGTLSDDTSGFTSWTPIGNSSKNYTGTFDGQNHTISGLYFNDTNTSYVGLFGNSQGTVKNVGVKDSYFNGDEYVGGVCGYNEAYSSSGTATATIVNCYNTGSVSGSNFVGGVCGENYADAYIDFGTATATATIENCYNTGSVTASGDNAYVGGVCGYNCAGAYAYSGTATATATITNSYFNSNNYSGKAVGYNNSTVTDVLSKTIEQFNSGEVAYLLQGEQTEAVWGQTLSGDDKQGYPVLGGAKVYCGYDNTCIEQYSNNELSKTPVHDYDKNGFCEFCGGYQPAEIINEETSQYKGYYAIENAGQLYWFAQQVNGGNTSANAVLTADITVNSNLLSSLKFDETGAVTNGDSFTNWTPIGNDSKNYKGTFDGQNYTISGLYFNDTNTSYVGLFGFNSGRIKNIGVKDSYFNGKSYVGGLCGYNGGIITNCYNTGIIISSFESESKEGDFGFGNLFSFKSSNLFSLNSSDNDYIYVGGVCGYNGGTITNCYNTGSVTAINNPAYVGGVCGYNRSGTITNCYFNSNNYSGNAISTNSGGTVTDVLSKTTAQFNSGEVAYLLQSGQTADDDGNIPEVWGQDLSTADSYPVLGGAKVYYGYDNTCLKQIYSNNELSETPVHDYSNIFCKFCGSLQLQPATLTTDKYDLDNNGTKDSVYEISTAGQLYWFAEQVNSGNTSINAVLTADITVNTGVLNEKGELNTGDFTSWTSIGNDSNKYTGTFDGQNHTISGLYFNNSSTDYVGLFGYNSGTVKNVGVEDSYFNGSSSVGGVCGKNYGTITNCYNTGTVSGSSKEHEDDFGFDLFNLSRSSNFSSSSDNDYVYVGGLCGYNGGTITNCYNTGSVTASGDYVCVGGMCGYNSNSGTITNCYYLNTTATGGINGEDVTGSAESKTKTQFNSGEVAYLLNNSTSEGTLAWGQDLSKDDSYPVLGGATVYKINKYNGCIGNPGEPSNGYSNTNVSVYAEHDYSSGGICKNCDALQNGKDGFKSASLTLTDGVIINYYLLLSSDALADTGAYIHFTSEQGLDKKIMLFDGVSVEGSDRTYKFSLELRPDQMADKITAQVVYGDSSEGSSVKYSVQKYAENVSVSDNCKNLVDAMLNYGAFTQLYTGNSTDNLVTTVSDYTTNASIDDTYNYKLDSKALGISVKSATLQIGAYTTIKVKYQLDEGANIENYTFKCGDTVLEPEKSGDFYYVYLRNISPQNLDEMYKFTVSDGINTTILEYSAFSYMKNILDNASSYDKTLVNLMNAMYYYNQSANAYVS